MRTIHRQQPARLKRDAVVEHTVQQRNAPHNTGFAVAVSCSRCVLVAPLISQLRTVGVRAPEHGFAFTYVYW